MQAMIALFGRYGGVAAINILPHEEEEFGVEVVYFDIRNAARAHQSLAGIGYPSRLAPQKGVRSVRLSGSVKVDVEMHKWAQERVSGFRKCEDGFYIYDFFDVCDADHFRRVVQRDDGDSTALEMPPGLEGFGARPGLTKGLPGASSSTSGAHCSSLEPTHRVVLDDLPSHILSEHMFKAVLQGAGLDGAYTSFKISGGPAEENHRQGKGTGKRRSSKGAMQIESKLPNSLGSATIYFSSRLGAERCRHHFHGAGWVKDGAVHASVETLPTAKARQGLLPPPCQTVLGLDSVPIRPPLVSAKVSPQLSADALTFQPKVAPQAIKKDGPASISLSPTAAEFHPGARAAVVKLCTASETSTDAGESSELEQIEDDARGGLGVFVGVGPKLGPGSLLNGLLGQWPKTGA